MSFAQIVLGCLGLALLMVVHEGGHYFAARAFNMRVTRFSIGFGPTLFRHQPKGSPTTFQLAIIPLLAYVQIAGMNPLEEIDPNDRGSYANASLLGRFTAIFAGPFANYLFASVLFFASLVLGGKEIVATRVNVQPNTPAAAAQMHDGDKIVAVAGQPVAEWEQMREIILAHPAQPIVVDIDRDGQKLALNVTPSPKGEKGGGIIGVTPHPDVVPVTLREATALSIERPAQVVATTIVGIGRMLTGKEKPDVSGPVGIVRETAKAVQNGLPFTLQWLGILSACLGAFNMLPIPALDGGRLLFLAYEAATRRRPNPRLEAQVHVVGLVMMLTLIVFVTFARDIPGHH